MSKEIELEIIRDEIKELKNNIALNEEIKKAKKELKELKKKQMPIYKLMEDIKNGFK